MYDKVYQKLRTLSRVNWGPVLDYDPYSYSSRVTEVRMDIRRIERGLYVKPQYFLSRLQYFLPSQPEHLSEDEEIDIAEIDIANPTGHGLLLYRRI